MNNGTLHIGVRGGEDQRSCSYCDCDDEWAGVDCGRCMDISVCPDRIIDNKVSVGIERGMDCVREA